MLSAGAKLGWKAVSPVVKPAVNLAGRALSTTVGQAGKLGYNVAKRSAVPVGKALYNSADLLSRGMFRGASLKQTAMVGAAVGIPAAMIYNNATGRDLPSDVSGYSQEQLQNFRTQQILGTRQQYRWSKINNSTQGLSLGMHNRRHNGAV